MHIILDGYAKNQNLLMLDSLLRDWLIKTAKLIGMTVYGEPVVVDFPWPGSNYTALSAICFLGESSIVVHTYPEFNFVFIDVFSCKDFDCDNLEGNICRDFGIAMPHVLQLQRGIRHRKIIPASFLHSNCKYCEVEGSLKPPPQPP